MEKINPQLYQAYLFGRIPHRTKRFRPRRRRLNYSLELRSRLAHAYINLHPNLNEISSLFNIKPLKREHVYVSEPP